jgi:hypothetical protein
VLLVGKSSYGALRTFVDQLATAFSERGYDATIFDFTQPSGALEALAASGPTELAFSFNILGDFRNAQGRSISEIFQAPHVIHFMDHPLTHLDRLEATKQDVALLTIDASHVDTIRSVYGDDRFAYVGFMPHAAAGEPVTEPDPEAFAAARPIPILFTGSFYKPGPPPWAKLAPAVGAVFAEAVERALACEWTPALTALDEALKARGFAPGDPKLGNIRKFASFVHEHVRSHRRFELLKAAAKAGLPLHIYGSGYDKVLYRLKNATYGGEASFDQSLELMQRSRVVLNINANFGAGSHDRPLSALLAGAAAATDYSSFYEQNFELGKEMATYRWMALSEDLPKLAELAEDPSAAFAMARSGQARVLAGHRWSHRVDTILAAADAVRARQAAR